MKWRALLFALSIGLLSFPIGTFAQATAPKADQAKTTDSKADTKSDATENAGQDDRGADEQAENGDASESPQTAEKKLQAAANQAGDSAKKTVEALKSGDISGAAKSGWDLLAIYGIPAIVALVVLIVSYFVASVLARICSGPIRMKVDETLGRFVGKVIFYLVMLGAVLGVLQYFGIGVTSFAAVIAAVGFAIGLAFQGTLSNFAAGVMLLVFRPFKVGDAISAAGITAKVHEIDLFTTTFDTPDNRRIIVPNSKIASDIIENITHHDERRVDVSVGVDYAADIDRTREVLLQAAQSVGGHLEGEGRGIQVYLVQLADSSVNWAVRVWYNASEYWPKREELTRAIKMHLDHAGIGIPFPQMELHLNR
jgi:small conductance mechanosensitive channel